LASLRSHAVKTVRAASKARAVCAGVNMPLHYRDEREFALAI